MNIGKKRLVLAVSAMSIALSGIVSAQNKGLEEIIVTARKTEENIQNIPVAITSLSADDLLKT